MRVVDQISITSILFVSFPEAIVVISLGILAIGKFSFFKTKSNIYRLLLHSAISCIFSFFIRRVVNNEIENLILSLIIVVLLSIFVLRLKFYESIPAVFFGFIILIITELIGLTSISTLTGITIDRALSNDLLRIVFVIPERIIQVALIYLFYQKNIKIINFEVATIKRKEYYIQLFVFITSISTLVILAVLMAKSVLFSNGNIENPTYALMLRINIYLTIFVTIILILAIKSTHEFYKSKSILYNMEFLQSLNYISTLIDNNNVPEAKETINKLKTHISRL